MPHVKILEHITSSKYFEVLGKDLVWVEGIIVNGHKTSRRNHWIFIVGKVNQTANFICKWGNSLMCKTVVRPALPFFFFFFWHVIPAIVIWGPCKRNMHIFALVDSWILNIQPIYRNKNTQHSNLCSNQTQATMLTAFFFFFFFLSVALPGFIFGHRR